MSRERVWCSLDGGTMYDDKTALGYERHSRGYGVRPGCWLVFYTGGCEASDFLDTQRSQGNAVMDDFGQLVEVH